MELYRNQHPSLIDADPTIRFIKSVNSLIRAMMSRTPKDALWPDSIPHRTIVKFLQDFEMWERAADEEKWSFLPNNTSYGIKTTLQATLEIFEFLIAEAEFKFLMTSGLNQDALERFFGMARSACGDSEHPDSVLFGQVFRLLSSYSLMKPPKGSNVSGAEMLTTLIGFNDLKDTRAGRQEWVKMMDSIIKGNIDKVAETPTDDVQFEEDELAEEREDIRLAIVSYITGYVQKKCYEWTKCRKCLAEVEATELDEKYHKLIELLSRGCLNYPSPAFISFLEKVESCIVRTAQEVGIHCDTLFEITQALQEITLPLVGCDEHKDVFSSKILNFYVMMRAEFLARGFRKNVAEAKSTRKQNKKYKKLNCKSANSKPSTQKAEKQSQPKQPKIKKSSTKTKRAKKTQKSPPAIISNASATTTQPNPSPQIPQLPATSTRQPKTAATKRPVTTNPTTTLMNPPPMIPQVPATTPAATRKRRKSNTAATKRVTKGNHLQSISNPTMTSTTQAKPQTTKPQGSNPPTSTPTKAPAKRRATTYISKCNILKKQKL